MTSVSRGVQRACPEPAEGGAAPLLGDSWGVPPASQQPTWAGGWERNPSLTPPFSLNEGEGSGVRERVHHVTNSANAGVGAGGCPPRATRWSPPLHSERSPRHVILSEAKNLVRQDQQVVLPFAGALRLVIPSVARNLIPRDQLLLTEGARRGGLQAARCLAVFENFPHKQPGGKPKGFPYICWCMQVLRTSVRGGAVS